MATGCSWPPYPYGPNEALLDLSSSPPNPAVARASARNRRPWTRRARAARIRLQHLADVCHRGHDDRRVDWASRSAQSSDTSAASSIFSASALIEIWSSLPFLYTIIIISSSWSRCTCRARTPIFQPSFWLLVIILAVFEWVSITYYIRGEFYREKARTMSAPRSRPASRSHDHLSPHSAECADPVVSFAPFVIVANIASLVALDFLGFGLPAPTPSWGELIGQGTREPDEVVARVLPARRAVPHPAAGRLHWRGRPRSVRSEGVLAAPMQSTLRLLDIRGLRTYFNTEAGVAKAVDGSTSASIPAKSWAWSANPAPARA